MDPVKQVASIDWLQPYKSVAIAVSADCLFYQEPIHQKVFQVQSCCVIWLLSIHYNMWVLQGIFKETNHQMI